MKVASGLEVRTWRGRFTFYIIYLITYYGVILLPIFVHEVLGHGLFTILGGGIFYAFYLSPFGLSGA